MKWQKLNFANVLCNVKLFLQWTFNFADNNVPRQALSTEATRNPGDHNQNKTDENLMLQVTIRNSKNVLKNFSEKRWRGPQSIFLRFWD